MDADGFKLVRTRKIRTIQKTHSSHPSKLLPETEDLKTSQHEVQKKVNNAKEDVLRSKFYKDLQGSLAGHSLDWKACVCYGLGNFASCYIARYQLALLLCLREDYFQSQENNFIAYDPKFRKIERDVLTDFGICALEFNEECKRKIDVPTLFFMPHCGKPMYNNLLWANWECDRLAKVQLLGNSFSNIKERTLSKDLADLYPYIDRISPNTTEIPVNNSFSENDVFNDLSIHHFKKEVLAVLPDVFWRHLNAPVYDPFVTEITLGP